MATKHYPPMRLRWSAPDACYVIEAIHEAGLAAHGDTPEDAIAAFVEASDLWFEGDDLQAELDGW